MLNEIALEAQNWAYNDGIGFGETFDGGIVLSVDKVFVGVVPVVEWWLLTKCVLVRWWF